MPRKNYERIEKDLVDAYIETIRDNYSRLSPAKKKMVLTGLEKMVDACEKAAKTRKVEFDGTEAARIREESGFTQIELSEHLGLGRYGQSCISRYEAGIRIPTYPPRGKVPEAYVGWLEDQGMDFSSLKKAD